MFYIYIKRQNMKIKYNKFGSVVYFENKDGYWFKNIFDENNTHIYYENYYGVILDYRSSN